MLKRMMEKAMGLERTNEGYRRAAATRKERSIFQALADEFGLAAEVDPTSIANIPADGPLIIVANHPCGIPEGMLIPALVDTVRDDLKPLAHTWFEQWPQVAERSVLLNPQAKGEGRSGKRRALLEAAEWVRSGNSLLVFPAGRVAGYRQGAGLNDAPWKPGLVRLVQMTRATVLPVRIDARNSLFFRLLARALPRLAPLGLIREMFRHRGRRIRIRIGRPIPHGKPPPETLLEDLRSVLERLGEPAAEVKSLETDHCMQYGH